MRRGRHEADSVGRGGRLASAAYVEFAQDRRDVMVDRLLGDEQSSGDLRVAQVLGQQRQEVELSGSEPGGVGAGLSARSPWDPASAAGPQSAPDAPRWGAGDW